MKDDVGTVGISKHAAEELGEVVFVDLPEKGIEVEASSTFGAVESVKVVNNLVYFGLIHNVVIFRQLVTYTLPFLDKY